MTLLSLITASIRDLHPAYFAMVMATGIVSIAAQLLQMRMLARSLAWLNLAAFTVLWLLTLARLFHHSSRVLADLIDHNRGVGFFTMVAASCVLGSQCLLVLENSFLARLLWLLGIVLWIVLTYTIFTALTVKEDKARSGGGNPWRLAHCGGGDAVGFQFGNVARAAIHCLSTDSILYLIDVVVGRHALYMDDLFDLLSLCLFSDGAFGSHPAVLDQHGRGGDLYFGGNEPDAHCIGLVVSSGNLSLSSGLYAFSGPPGRGGFPCL